MEFKSFMEVLKGKQHKIDKNKNGKIDAHDFKLLQKEEQEITEATVKTQKYSWGTMKTVHHGSDFSIPLHPEHHEAIAKLKDQQEHKFKTEDGKHWTARRKGDEVHFQGANNGGSTKVKQADLKEEVQICETADAGLAAKAAKSGISIGTRLSPCTGCENPVTRVCVATSPRKNEFPPVFRTITYGCAPVRGTSLLLNVASGWAASSGMPCASMYAISGASRSRAPT
jgi:hypothetical protein